MGANIKESRVEQTIEGTRNIVKVRFLPQVPNPAKQTDIEAVYEFRSLDVYIEDKEPLALTLLSCTLCDTREPFEMPRPMGDVITQQAMLEISNFLE